jgi:hypothetical protein
MTIYEILFEVAKAATKGKFHHPRPDQEAQLYPFPVRLHPLWTAQGRRFPKPTRRRREGSADS